MDFGIIFEPHIILTSTSLLHRSLLRYCKNIWLFLSGIKSLPNQHRVIPIRRFFYPSQLFIIEFSIGIHQFRQNPCALHSFHFTINNIITDKIFEGFLVLFVPGTKKLPKKLVITSIRWFVDPPDLALRSSRRGIHFILQFCKTNVLQKKNSRDLSNDVLFKIEVRIGVHELWWNPCTPNSVPLTRFITLVTDSDNHLIEIIFSLAAFNKFDGYDIGGIFV